MVIIGQFWHIPIDYMLKKLGNCLPLWKVQLKINPVLMPSRALAIGAFVLMLLPYSNFNPLTLPTTVPELRNTWHESWHWCERNTLRCKFIASKVVKTHFCDTAVRRQLSHEVISLSHIQNDHQCIWIYIGFWSHRKFKSFGGGFQLPFSASCRNVEILFQLIDHKNNRPVISCCIFCHMKDV